MTVRPRIQRAFFAWFDEARPRLKRDISIVRRTDRSVEFTFHAGTDALRGWLYRNEVVIAVDYDGTCWDLLIAYDVYPRKIADGYICTECPPDAQHIHPSREALWRDHLFDPLLRWVNEELATATGLALYDYTGMTCAELVRAPVSKPDVYKVIDLR